MISLIPSPDAVLHWGGGLASGWRRGIALWLGLMTLGGMLPEDVAAEDDAPRRYALVVGVNKYRPNGGLGDLFYAEPDAKALSQVLRMSGYTVIEMTADAARREDEPRLSPTAAYIVDELDRLLDSSLLGKERPEDKPHAEDALMICLHGHGIQLTEYPLKDGQPDRNAAGKSLFYFCPADADIRNVKTVHELKDRNNLIALNDLYDRLRGCRAATRLLVVDACRNDPSSPPPQGFRSESITMPQLPPPPEGWALMQSCRANERAIESKKLGHGVFTHFLIKGLSGDADLAPKGQTGDGIVTMSELASYVGSNTSSFVRANHRPFTQSPEVEGRYDTNTPLVKVIETLGEDLRELLATIARTAGTPDYTKRVAPTRAKLWFEAARNGSPVGLLLEGECHEYGIEGKPKDPGVAFAKYKTAADLGLPLAFDYVAYCYREGVGVEKDLDESRKWYQKAADNGVSGSLISLGQMFLYGNGVTTDTAKGIRLLNQAAEAGQLYAWVALGEAEMAGVGMPENKTAALAKFRRAAEGGNADGQNWLGAGLRDGDGTDVDLNEAFKWFMKSAEQGLASAQDNVGYAHQHGQGTPENKKEAARWFRKAADQNFAISQMRLATLFEAGEGVRKDSAEAFKWYLKSAENGHMSAAHAVGRCYENGIGTGVDETESFRWYTVSAEGGDALGQTTLGNCYANGYGTEQDDAEAVRWYRLASEQGNASATSSLGLMHFHGRGVEEDEAEGYRLFRKAAHEGDADGMLYAGQCLRDGTGVEKNESEAFRYFEMGAALDHTESVFSLGACYDNGTGVAKDPAKAVELYERGVAVGHAGSLNNLGFSYQHGNGVKKDERRAVELYRKSADAGWVFGMYNLAWCYENGVGLPMSREEALTWYRKAAAEGHEASEERVRQLTGEN